MTERVSRVDRAAIRRRLIARIRDAVTRSGGVWARLAAYPHPYRSAFNFRADLDEPCPDDYARFARARRPIDDCSTHFVSTHAYGESPDVLADLKGLDTQSHGHYHVVYRHEAANRRNLERADMLLRENGFRPAGFAAPEGRWNAGLDRAMETLGYEYASDFHLGHDDLPFFPRRDGRFSRVLQVPIHPICEGLFLDAGADDPAARIARHLIATARAKVESGEPAFLYGHPERRLGRFPEVVSTLAAAVGEMDRVWRVTLTEFARWWLWRTRRSWSLAAKGEGRYEVQFEDWDGAYPMALEVVRGDHVASVPLVGPRQVVRPGELAYVRGRPERTARIRASGGRRARAEGGPAVGARLGDRHAAGRPARRLSARSHQEATAISSRLDPRGPGVRRVAMIAASRALDLDLVATRVAAKTPGPMPTGCVLVHAPELRVPGAGGRRESTPANGAASRSAWASRSGRSRRGSTGWKTRG